MSLKNRKVYALIAVAIVAVLVVWHFQNIQAQTAAAYWAVTLEYEDGTFSNKFEPPTSLILTPLTIVDTSGKAVKNLRTELYVTVDYAGEAQSWSATGTLYWKIMDANLAEKYSTSIPLSVSGSTPPPNKQAFVITSATVSASDIENMWTGWVKDTTYYLRFDARGPLTFTINFADGPQSKTTVATLDWKFTYKSPQNFNSLSVSWNPVPYY